MDKIKAMDGWLEWVYTHSNYRREKLSQAREYCQKR